MNAVNAYFYAQVAAWSSCMFAYCREEDYAQMGAVANYDALNKVTPALLLILSILLFRFRFNGNKSKQVFARENIIAIHVIIFVSFIITYAPNIVLYSYYVSSPEGSIQECRFLIS